jgi:hypothetical protein
MRSAGTSRLPTGDSSTPVRIPLNPADRRLVDSGADSFEPNAFGRFGSAPLEDECLIDQVKQPFDSVADGPDSAQVDDVLARDTDAER